MSTRRSTWTAVRADLGHEIYDQTDALVATVPVNCSCAQHLIEAHDRAELIAAAPLMRDVLRRIARMAETGEYGIAEIAAGTLAGLARLDGDAGTATSQSEAASQVLDALQFAVRFHDQLTPADIERMRSIITRATEAAS